MWTFDALGDPVISGDMLVINNPTLCVLVLDIGVSSRSDNVTRMLLSDGSIHDWFGSLRDFRRVVHAVPGGDDA